MIGAWTMLGVNRDDAFCRSRCYEERRVIGRLDLIDEDEWLESLDDREVMRIIRELNAVDRAVVAARRAREAA